MAFGLSMGAAAMLDTSIVAEISGVHAGCGGRRDIWYLRTDRPRCTPFLA
jgi:hypothetical protein